MVENNSNSDSVRDMYVAPDFKEIIDGIRTMPNITKEEEKRILQELQESINFSGNIDKIEVDNLVDRVIFTDGDMQLLYEDGEYYVVSATDSKKVRKKIRKEEAKDMYLEYFIKYQLNPLIEKSKARDNIRTKTKEVKIKNSQQSKKKTKEKESIVKDVDKMKSKNKSKEKDSLSR